VISDRLKKTLLAALHLDDWEISGETFAYEVPGWDSLNHVAVICAVEAEFGVRFSPAEVVALENVGDLEQLVDRKLGTPSGR